MVLCRLALGPVGGRDLGPCGPLGSLGSWVSSPSPRRILRPRRGDVERPSCRPAVVKQVSGAFCERDPAWASRATHLVRPEEFMGSGAWVIQAAHVQENLDEAIALPGTE